MKFTDRLKKAAQPIWDKAYEHPFVQGIGDGTLPMEKYKYYMCQDYPYLIESSRVQALGCVKAPTLGRMSQFSELLKGTLDVEMDLHRRNSLELGITKEELETTQLAPTAQAYVSFLEKTAFERSFLHICVVITPCIFSYPLFGKRLFEIGNEKAMADKVYGEWIRYYNSPEAAEYGDWLIDIIDEESAGLPERELKDLEKYFLKAAKYDYMFFDMAWNEEKWMVD